MMNTLEARVDMLEKKLAAANINTPEQPKNNNKKNKEPKQPKEPKPEKVVKEKKSRVSGYMLFMNANREDVLLKMTDENNGVKPVPTLVMSELGKLWKQLSDEDKLPYNQQAQAIREQNNNPDP